MNSVVRAVVFAVLASALAAQAQWFRQFPTQAPSTRYGATMCEDALGHLVLVSGHVSSGPADTWLWDGSNWSSATGVQPATRSFAGMAYDSARQRVVLFGGQGVNNLQDTWEWDGTVWQQRTPQTVPGDRFQCGFAYDPVHARTLMFGGLGTPGVYSDFWSWDGQDWHAIAVPGPSARVGAAMAFDPVSRSMLLFGGAADAQQPVYDETWLWDGAAWSQQQPSTPPYPRESPGIATDSLRGRVVLMGGDWTLDPWTWEWDGSEWHALAIAGPSPRRYQAMAYDSTRQEVVLCGGLSAYPYSTFMNDTWSYRTDSPASFTAYGNGCAGSTGVPALANAPNSLPWLGDTFRTRVTPLASATSTVVFATSVASTLPVDLAPYGMPGCYSLVDTSIIALDFVAAAANAAEWSIAVPNSAALNGAHIFQQAIALEAGANSAGAIVSNAGDIGVGIR